MGARGHTEVPADALLQLLERRAPRPLSIPEMVRMLALEHYDRKQIKAALEAGVAQRTLRRIGKTRYQWVREAERTAAPARTPRTRSGGRVAKGPAIEGHYRRVRAGYGFVEVVGRAAERFPRDILIPSGMEGDAMHGDRVAVEIVRRDLRARRVVGRIVSVTERVHAQIIGTLERHRGTWVLLPEDERLPPVAIVGEAPRPSDAGQVALVRLTQPPTATRGPGGALVKILGVADDPEVQFLSISLAHGLRIEFPPEALAEAARLPADPSPADLAGREDLRHLPFVTIDGETARDFDDAVCLETLPGGGTRLWVAIADVAHYVPPGSALDTEAGQRGTSVYFPDRAVPMLPAQLSNQLCSLNPERDRLVLVAEMTYDREGHRQAARFYRAVMRSRARLTYTKVAGVLSDADTPDSRDWRAQLASLVPQLQDMQVLMRLLYRNRVAAGSLDLDLPEALIDLSEEGRSIGIRLLERNDAHRLIEEFMLEANRAVAIFLKEQRIPLPYRIHEPPEPDDIDDLNEFLQAFGLFVRYDGRVEPRDVQRVLTQLREHRLARVLSRQVLRALKQARYSTANVGHFGLAFPIYCHFTSPIRRYPDLIVHRQLGRLFDGRLEEARAAADAIEAASTHSSQRERDAMEAERAMVDLRKAEFMLQHLHEPEPGTIVSVVSFGLFIELDAYPVEGLVRADDLTDDRYYFIEAERALKGMRTKRRFRLGDRVVVEATNVSLRRRQIDFALLQRLDGADAAIPTPQKHRGKQTRQPRAARKAGRAKTK